MQKEDVNDKRLVFDWDSIFSEALKLSHPEQAIIYEFIKRPLIQKGFYEFRESWKIPAETGLQRKSQLENNPDFQKEYEARIRKKFGFPEYLSQLIMHFVLYGKIHVPEKFKENELLRNKMDRAIDVAKYFGNEGHFLYQLEGAEKNSMEMFNFTHGGTTVGIDASDYSVFIKQSVTAKYEEIDELKNLIEGYKDALRMHQNQLRDRKNKHGESFLIDCLVYRAIVEEGHKSKWDILAFVQSGLGKLLKISEEDVEAMEEFKISEKTKDEDTFFTRVKRLKREILGRDIEDE